MTLSQITKIRGPGIHTTSNIVSHNINSSGIITAVAFKGPFTGSSNIQSGIVTATKIDLNGDIDVDGHTNLDNVSIAGVATFAGNVSIGGTLTYEDVTNIDSVGIITARDGLKVLAGGANVVGVITATTFKGNGDFVELDVDGHTNLDNVSIAGVTTASGAIDLNADLDVDGHTNLDNVSVAGVTTFSDAVRIVKTAGPLLELTTNTGAADATLRLSEGATGSTTNGGGMYYSGADNKLYITCGTNSTTKRITIQRDDGKVGINRTSPARHLHIYSPGAGFPAKFESAYTYCSVEFADNGTVSVPYIGSKNDHLVAGIGNTERLRITSDGKVGIGSDNPQELLSLMADGPCGISLIDSGHGQVATTIKIGNTGKDLSINVPEDILTTLTNGNYKINTNGSERLRIASNGLITATQANSAIGLIVKNSAHNSQLQILATASNKNSEIWFGDAGDDDIGKIDYDHNDNSLAFTVNTSERLRIDSSGRLLVGTDVAPSSANTLLRVHTPISSSSVNSIEISHNTNGADKAGAALGLAINNGGASTNAADLYFSTATNGSLVQRLWIKADGKIGINVSDPDSNLEIDRGSVGKYLTVGGDDANNGRGLSFTSSTDNTGSNGALHTINAKSGNGAIALATSGTEALRINNYGALLVGTTAPAYTGGDLRHEIKKNNSRTYTAPLMVAHSHLLLNNSDTTTNNFVGIGMRTGTGDGAVGFVYTGVANHSDFVICTDSGANGAEKLRIKSQTGRVGISQANPQAKLDVSGAYNEIGIRASGGASGYSSAFVFQHANGDTVLEGNNARHVIPGADAVQDLGISTKRWRNVYTTDLQLSNVGGGGNEVDGTEGTWTLQEGEDDIYMINRKTGKKYKMMLQEVS